MSIWAAIPSLIGGLGGLLKGGAKNSFNRITGAGPIVRGAQAPGTGALTSAVAGGAGAILAPTVIGAAGSGLTSTGNALQRLAGNSMRGIAMTGKKRRRKGISASELKGFRRVYKFLDDHVEPKLKIKRKKCR
jgi:hypothetical protein